jgi:pimeloyl-ACP methyl ester carboxylesterase
MPRSPLAYDRLGHGPTVVLLHPTGLGPAVLLPFAERLGATDHDVVVPHRRRYGRSASLEAAATLDDHVDDLALLLDDLAAGDNDRPITLVGVSAGATIALAFATRHPEVDVRILAHEPLIGPLAPLLHARVSGRIDRLRAREDRPLELSLFISELIGRPTWNALPAAWRDGVERNHDAALAEVGFYASFELGEQDLRDLGRAGVTTSVGARSGEARHEAADVLRAHGLGVLVLPDCGHLAPFEAPTAFAGAVDLVPGQGVVVATAAATAPDDGGPR